MSPGAIGKRPMFTTSDTPDAFRFLKVNGHRQHEQTLGMGDQLTQGTLMDVNITRLNLTSIRLAIFCAELGSLSAAAKRAHTSLSAASQRIKALEEAFGRALFIRDAQGLRLTSAGALLVEHGKLVFSQLELMRFQVQAVSPSEVSLFLNADAQTE